MSDMLDSIDTIVLVMMENRSFDHMLGHLTIDHPELDVNGLRTADMASYSNDHNGDLFPSYEIKNDTDLETDLPHEEKFVQEQLKYQPVNDKFTMHGFVDAYVSAGGGTPNVQCIPMGYFGSAKIPVTEFFAKNFCVCDNWFAPIPTSTQPNRTMAFCGYTPIYQTKTQLIELKEGKNIFAWMDKHQVRWRVYHDGFPFFSLYPTLWPYVLGEQFSRFELMYSDRLHEADATAPQVIIVEPCYQDAPHFGSKHPNDNHPPLAIGWGEDFLRRVYQAVSANPDRWERTLMIVYYDEHGGFFDHVAPPGISCSTTGKPSFPFKSLGVRIPAVVVSPFVTPGSCSHALMDHTSVLQLLAEKFDSKKIYSPDVEKRRRDGIRSVSEVLENIKPFAPPNAPSVALDVKTALGESIAVAPDSPMRQSFEEAGRQMLEQKPAEVRKKFPELFQWKDAADKARGTR